MINKFFGQKAGKPNPRFIDILSHDWHAPIKQLEPFKTPDVLAGVCTSAALTLGAYAQNGLLTASSVFAIGIGATFATSAALKMATRISRQFKVVSGYAIDREGRSMPPENNMHLLFEIESIALRNKALFIGHGVAAAAFVAAPMIAFPLMGLGGFYLPVAPISIVSAAHHWQVAQVANKLMAREYTFCGTPPAEPAKKRVTLPAAFRPKAA